MNAQFNVRLVETPVVRNPEWFDDETLLVPVGTIKKLLEEQGDMERAFAA